MAARLDAVRLLDRPGLQARRHPDGRERQHRRDERLADVRPKYGLPVVLLDVLKGFVPALLGTILVSHWLGVARRRRGDDRPLAPGLPALRARREDGRDTCAGVYFGVAPLVALAGAVIWLLLFFTLRYASVSSMVAAAAMPVVALAIGEPAAVVVFGFAAAAAVVVLHRQNIVRLFRGTENRFELRRRAQPQA